MGFNPLQFVRKDQDISTLEPEENEIEIEQTPQNTEIEEFQEISKTPENTFDPSQFSRKQDETWKEWATRQGVRSTARIVEGLAGNPGNLKKFFKDLIISSYENATLSELDPTEYGKKQREAPDWLKNIMLEGNPEMLGGDYPTTEEIKDIGKDLASILGEPGYLDPKNYIEEQLDETLTDFGTLLFPGGPGRGFMQKLGISAVSNMGGEIAGLYGADEKEKQQVKMGLMFMMDLATRGNAREHGANLLEEAEELIPPGDIVDASQFLNNLDRLERRIRVGGVAPSDRPALYLIDELRGRIQQGGQLAAHELPAMNRTVNEIRGNVGGFELPVRDRPRAVRHVNDVHEILGNEINQYGQTNPEFYNLWRQGNEAFAVWAQSNVVSNYIQGNYTKPVVSDGAKLLFYSGVGQAGLGKAATIATTAAIPYRAMQLSYRIARSPVLRRYYSGVVRNAAIGNLPAMIRNMEKLDKELDKEEKKSNKNGRSFLPKNRQPK